MSRNVKIATCCYCGTRAALRLCGRERHELACAACGAPLRAMKRLREDHAGRPSRPKRSADIPAGPKAATTAKPIKARGRRRKSAWRKALGDAFDLIEDILD